ncbi:hypothetical protein [Streptomyces sp. NBC_00503]|nr:hypothetical protein [Streptomyces sp. NBC_00503]WUD85772.1 hypothetical protein OG490_37395 [Streptomyces sp. NBC_00503]
MLDCPNPPPVTVVLDPYDDVVHTRARRWPPARTARTSSPFV